MKPTRLGTKAMTNDDQPAASDAAEVTAVPETAPIAAPIVALDADGRERPRSGGSFVRIDGKLQRKDA